MKTFIEMVLGLAGMLLLSIIGGIMLSILYLAIFAPFIFIVWMILQVVK